MVLTRRVLGNLLAAVIPAAVVLVTIPAYIHVLGLEKYGVLAIVWILFGYAGALDLGMAWAVNGAVSRASAEGLGARQQIIWSGIVIASVIGIGVAALAAASYPLWSRIIAPDVMAQLSPALPYIILGIPLLTITSILNGAIEGVQRFDVANMLQIGAAGLYQIGPLAVAYAIGPTLPTIILSVIACRVIAFLAYLIANERMFRIFGNIAPRRDRLRELIRYGHGIALVNILDPLLNRADQFLIAYLTGPAGVASYNIAVSAVQRVTIIPMAMSRTLFPTLSASRIREYLAGLIDTERKLLWIWFAICVAGVIAAGLAFRLWLGASVAADVTLVARVLIAGIFLNSLAYLPYTALQAEGRGVQIMKAHLIELPVFLVSLPALALTFGTVGAATAWSLRAGLDFFILWRMCGRPARSLAIAIAMFGALLAFGLLARTWGV